MLVFHIFAPYQEKRDSSRDRGKKKFTRNRLDC
ncbi:hypothetical protein E1A91_A11G315700v1 [Gossypium mustelinum]|uniref:Uncharacterized protein n=1 Tax=Gossypium mustelinum TaxID=34275 RepID=A0A5D2XD50_GOSMU|nr:hypothetical protein E1A91_A11G315700v1 [Gossypium mustelinum]